MLLVLLGCALAKLAWTGDYLKYVRPSALPWLAGAAMVMLGLGLVAIARDFRTPNHEPAGEHDHEHGHAHGSRSAWLLLLPVFAVLFIAPGALGAESVVGTDGNTRVAASVDPEYTPQFPALPEGGVVPLSMSEFQTRAAWDTARSLDGRTVQLTGFVVHERGSTFLARMVIGCCAADAYPVKVRLGGDAAAQAAAFADDAWLKVTGQLLPGSATAETRYVPEVAVSAVEKTAEPREPYE